MQKIEPKKIISYSTVGIFLIFLSYLLIYFYLINSFIQQYNLLFIIIFILSAVLFIISILNLEISLLIFIFFIPLFNSLPYILGNLHDFPSIYFLFIGLFLGSLINIVKRNKSLLYFNELRIYIPIFIFIILCLISFIFTFSRLINFYPFIESKVQSYTINVLGWNNFIALSYLTSSFLNYLSGFLLLLIIINIDIREKFIKYFFYIISISFLVVFLIMLYQIFINPGFGNIDYWVKAVRVNSTLTDPNSLGEYIFILFPIFIGFGYYFYGRNKYLSIFSFVLCLLALIMMSYSGSRTSIVGIGIIFLIYFIYLGVTLFKKIFQKFNLKKIVLNIISYFLILSVLLLFFFGLIFIVKNAHLGDDSPIILSRIKSDIEKIGKSNFLGYVSSISSGRNILWKQAINMFLDYPVSGVGIGQYYTEISNYNVIKYGITSVIDITNNYYLQILSEMGMVALMIILWFFIEVFLASIFVFKIIVNKRFKFLYFNFLLCFIVTLIIFNTGPNIIFFEIQYIFMIIIGFLINFRINFDKESYQYILNENS